MPNASKAKTKSALKFILPAIIVASVLVLMLNSQSVTGPRVSFANASLKVEVADSLEERRLGLSGKPGLAEDEGMLFIFNTSSFYGFWMKDMRFPIDIMWLDESRRIVHVETRISPETYPQVFYPNLPARYVLEANSGWAQTNGVKVGDIAHFDL